MKNLLLLAGFALLLSACDKTSDVIQPRDLDPEQEDFVELVRQGDTSTFSGYIFTLVDGGGVLYFGAFDDSTKANGIAFLFHSTLDHGPGIFPVSSLFIDQTYYLDFSASTTLETVGTTPGDLCTGTLEGWCLHNNDTVQVSGRYRLHWRDDY